jgi:hypothetical protein
MQQAPAPDALKFGHDSVTASDEGKNASSSKLQDAGKVFLDPAF